ncbi:hypothetical protein LPJ75_001228 [Coemansia sp. RSA 2598]|nr:hypothetical protein LPJ75_001228 [Coemansia sp. RSA 2598]
MPLSSGTPAIFVSSGELGQTYLGFHNNRFAQVPIESLLSSLGLPASPAAEDHMQVIPTSSEPRVISVNVVLPTFAIKITEDPNSLSMATVLSIDPNMEVASVTPTLDTSEEAVGAAKDSLFLTVDNGDFTSLSVTQASAASEATASPTPTTAAAAVMTTATMTVTTTAEKIKPLASTTRPIPIFGTPEIATKKALGRLALDMDDPRFTATMDQPEFTQSLVTRTVNKNRASGRQRHEITIDDYDLAGILRMTNLASLASQLLLSNGVSDLAALDLPTLSPALAGPVFSVPKLPALTIPLPPSPAASGPLAAMPFPGPQPSFSLAPQMPLEYPPSPFIRPPPSPQPPPPSHTGPPVQPTPQPPPPSHTGPPVQPTPQPPPPSHTGPPVQPTPQPPPPSHTGPPVQPTLQPPPPSHTGPPVQPTPQPPPPSHSGPPFHISQQPPAPSTRLPTPPQPPTGPSKSDGLPEYLRPPQLFPWSNVLPMDASQAQAPVPQPLPLPVPQASDSIGSLPGAPQAASEIDPALVFQIPTAARPSAIPISSSPFNIMPPVNTRASPPTLVSLPQDSVAPLIMQDTNTVIYTPIIPFITDGTRRETPTPNAIPVNDAKGGINASGIASILQDVFHIPPSAISIDGKPLAAGGSGSGRMDGKKDGDSDSDDDGDNDGNSDDEDSGSAAQGEPQDLEKELQSRLGIEMNKNRNRDRFRAHIKIIGASIKDKGRHADLVKGIPGNKAKGRFRGMIKGKDKSKHRGSTLLAVDSDSDSSDDDASSGNLSQSVRSQMSTADGSHTTIDMVDGTPTIILDSRSDMGADTESSTATDKIPFSTSSSIEDIDDQTSKFEMIIEDENDSRSNA